MTLKPCPCCKEVATTKTAIFLKRMTCKIADLLYFNCSKCKSTFVIKKIGCAK